MKRNESAVQRLQQLIPVENVNAYLHIYQKIESIEYNKDFDTLDKLNSAMRTLLTQAKGHNFLSAEGKTQVWDAWSSALWSTIDTPRIRLEVMKEEFKGQAHKHTENDTRFLVYALFFDLKTLSGKPHYSLIADVLNEMKKGNKTQYGLNNISHAIKRIQPANIYLALNSYHKYFTDKGKSLLPDNVTDDPKGFLRELCRILLDKVFPEDLSYGESKHRTKLGTQ
jgi:hypothetical protein